MSGSTQLVQKETVYASLKSIIQVKNFIETQNGQSFGMASVEVKAMTCDIIMTSAHVHHQRCIKCLPQVADYGTIFVYMLASNNLIN